jgi:Fur family peroxide stress response transcriptional regulator
MRRTAQREAILACVRGRTDHPSAEEVYACVHARLPGLSRTTVYRVLEALLAAGTVRRVNQPGARARFDARMDRHDHVTCRRCERIVDVDGAGPGRVRVPRVPGFRVEDWSIHFTGLCRSCRPRKRRQT